MSRAPISVVIPTLNAALALRGCFAALTEGLEAGVIREVIVSDGGSTDETVAVAEAAGAEIVSGAATRGGQLRRGCAAAQGEWIFVLHADSWPAPGWAEAAARHMAQGGAGWGLLAFRATGMAPRIVAGWANLRSRILGLPYGDQGLLLPRTLYDSVGGYPDQPLMEDVALVRSLRGQLHPMDFTVSTGAERYEAQGWLRRGTHNLGTLLRYQLGADPKALARRYAGR